MRRDRFPRCASTLPPLWSKMWQLSANAISAPTIWERLAPVDGSPLRNSCGFDDLGGTGQRLFLLTDSGLGKYPTAVP
jgi:hypothetical protein